MSSGQEIGSQVPRTTPRIAETGLTEPLSDRHSRSANESGAYKWGIRRDGEEKTAPIVDAWLSAAELALLEWVPAGCFGTTLREEQFRILDAANPRQTAHEIE